MLYEIISAVLQILVFTLIPFVVYLVKQKSAKGFLNYIGLKKSNSKANLLALLVCLFIALPLLVLSFLNPGLKAIMTNPNSVTGKVSQMGFSTEAIVFIIIAAVFKTSFSEEILFRGFIAKRLINITNYRTGNILQAIIFGAVHSALFMAVSSNLFFLAIIFLFPAIGAYFQVYLNEKVAGGSIIPGWIAHGLANLISYSAVGFLF